MNTTIAGSTQSDTPTTTDGNSHSYCFYDTVGGMYNMTPQHVSALARKHGILRKKIYGRQTVDANEWRKLMQRLDISLAPGHTYIIRSDTSFDPR